MRYIYSISDPETHEVRYVGQTENPDKRFYEHLFDKVLIEKYEWMASLKNKGLNPIFAILKTTDDDINKVLLCEREIALDYISKGNRLFNTNQSLYPITGLSINCYNIDETVKVKIQKLKQETGKSISTIASEIINNHFKNDPTPKK